MKMSEYRRQHPMMMVIEASRSAPAFIGLAFVFSISSLGVSLAQFAVQFSATFLVLLLISSVFNSLSWAFFWYRHEPGYVHIRRGVVFKSERSIKRERVQSVNVYTNILQRAAGLATLQIKTAGTGEEAEVNLRALTLEEVEAIKSHLKKDYSPDSPPEEEAEEAVHRLDNKDLWLAGITSGRFLVLFSVIGVVFSQLFTYIPDWIYDYALELLIDVPLAAIAIAAILLFLLSWALSIISFVVQYARFTIRRYEDRLEISWGILKQNHVTVGLHRLQALVVMEGVFRQPLGLSTLYIEVAGGGAEGQEQISMLHPLVRIKELQGFLGGILPEYSVPAAPVELPQRSLRRYLLRAMAPAALFAVAAWAALAEYGIGNGWLALLLLVPAALLGMSRHANGRTAVEGCQMTLRFRDINRYTVMINKPHLQSLSLLANPFQRYNDLRTVRAAVLSSPSGKSFQVKDVDADEARRAWEWYSHR